jgi:hypothetical protein
MNPRKPIVDPMREGHPEPFSEPRTIPTAWDVTGWIPMPQIHTAAADMNGTAYDQTNQSSETPDE